MTTPSPEAVAAAVEHCRERMKQYWESPDVDRDKLETILAALSAQSEELAELKERIEMMRDPDFAKTFLVDAAMQQEQKPTPPEGPAPAPTSQ